MQGILAKVAIKNHYNGSLNHYAQFRKIINEADYFNSRWVSFPLRTFDALRSPMGRSPSSSRRIRSWSA